MLNWPTAIALVFSLGIIYGIISEWIDRNRPRPMYCARCLRELGEDAVQKHRAQADDSGR